jgi:hypothetical protein
MTYQENELIRQHVALGHEVTVIAATDTYSPDKQIVYTNPASSTLRCGAHLIRLPYAFGLGGWLASKIRIHSGLQECLNSLRPDRILFHGLCAWDLQVVASYVKKNRGVKLFADCHEDFNNSAMSWASRELLHKRFYKPIFLRSIHHIHEVLSVTVESLDFAVNFYDSPSAKTRIYPLGCSIESNDNIARRRLDFRAQHGLIDTDIVITQTGKLDRTKKLVSALLAFRANPSTSLKFVIAGRMTGDVKAECLPLIKNDSRVIDLGWQTADELCTVLAGADCFLQPFGQTVTTQMAMGYSCVILAQDLPSHRWLVGDNGYLFHNAGELERVFCWVIENQVRLDQLKLANSKFAATYLDYRELALQIVA